MENRILLSLVLIGSATALAGVGTFALFTDTGSSSGNIFTASTLDLKLGGADSLTATIGNSNFSPGDSTSGSFSVVNAGTIENAKVDVDLAFDVTNSANNMAKNLTVTSLTYGARDLLAAAETCWAGAAVQDTNGNGRIDLADIDSQTCVDLAAANSPGTTFGVTVNFDNGAGNENQGESVTLVIRAQLTQIAATDISA